MKNTATYLVIILIKILARLPFRALYIFSDLISPVLFHLIRYRRKIVFTNLMNSFPEKGREEIRLIARNFYRHLCDLFLESMKVRCMDQRSFETRMIVRGADHVNYFFDRGRSVIILATHYCNWEWMAILPLYLRHRALMVYKPLQNVIFDKYLNETRELLGSKVVPMSITLRKIIESENRKELILTWLAADQTPPWNHKFWTVFLNQEAMFFNGPARIARRFNLPVFFQYTRRIARGRYETGFELLFDNPSEVSEVEIIKTYVSKLEALIRAKPEFYLWSHKRWKHRRPPGLPLN